MGSEILDAALASLLKKACALGRASDVHAASVAGIPIDFNQKVALESSHDPAHRGWLDVLCSREFSQRFGASKNHDR